MKTKLDIVNVIDLECCCWRGKPAGDIIEIGISTIDLRSAKIKGSLAIIVKPEQDEISDFCTELTTLTPEFVEKEGISFEKACKRLEIEHQTRTRVWASYGDFDRIHFQRMCYRYNLAYPFGRTHINIKNLIALLEGWNKEIGMAGAYNKFIGTSIEGTHHRGVDDARNIAYIFKNILDKYRKDYNVC